jgi:23S rRNA pseudouridine2605 synthase
MKAGAPGGPAGDRLAKFLAHCGVAARRQAETDYIARGRVTVNGQVVVDPAVRVRRGDTVAVDGRAVRPEVPVAIVVHKPRGVLCAARDARGRTTVVDLVGPRPERLYPVGRLDADSEGLLVVTNDGALAQALLHPRHGVPRTYAALVTPVPDAGTLWRLEQGVRLSDGFARAEDVETLARAPRGAAPGPGVEGAGWIRVVLRGGRNRQVRRMCAAVGLDVLRLVRTGFGGLHLEGIPPAGWRELTAAEVSRLRAATGADTAR